MGVFVTCLSILKYPNNILNPQKPYNFGEFA